jgi:hypothetical protein
MDGGKLSAVEGGGEEALADYRPMRDRPESELALGGSLAKGNIALDPGAKLPARGRGRRGETRGADAPAGLLGRGKGDVGT